METEIGGQKDDEYSRESVGHEGGTVDRVGGGRSGSLETNFSEIDWKTNTGAKRSWLKSDDPLNY